jgi:hypothetical protein
MISLSSFSYKLFAYILIATVIQKVYKWAVMYWYVKDIDFASFYGFLLLYFGNIPTVWYFIVFHFVNLFTFNQI